MAKQYIGTKLQDLGNFEVLDPTDRILVIKPNDEGIMALSEFLLYVKANLDFSNYLTAKQVNDTFATKVDTYTRAEADGKFAFVDKTYTRTQTDAKFAVRADTFTKDEALGLFASTNNIYLKEEVYNKEEALHAFALKSEIPVLPDLSAYSTTAKGDLRWVLKTDVYAKTESDVRYPLAVNTYSKSDSDVRFAKAANTYTKDEVEAKFLDNNEAYTKSYIDQSIYLKSQVYTKLETDAKFQLKNETYTISDVNSQFAAKSWVYSRGEAELTFAPKADTYTKTEVNTLTDTKVAALAKNLNDNYYNKSVSDARYTPVGTSYSKTETDTKYPVKGQTATSISLNPTSLIYTMVDGTSKSVTVPTWNQSTTGNAATATKLQTARTINGVPFDGTANITTPAYNSVYTLDNRTLKPADIPSRTVTAAFSTQVGMNGTAPGTDYLDVLALNTWDNNSGGSVNALVFNKTASQGIYHYIGGVGANAWTAYKQLAYTDSSITGNAATATKMQTPRSIGITGAVTGAGVNFDGTSNIAINTTAVDASKLTGIVPNASISGIYTDVTLDISNGLMYSVKQPGSNNSVTAYGLGSIRGTGTTQNSVIVIKTNIPKDSVNVLSLHIKGLSDSESTNIDITISGWIKGNISKLSLGTKDYDIRKAQSSDGYVCFIISHPSGYLGPSTSFSIVTAHLNFGVDVSTLSNWSIFETTNLSTFTNISQPAAQSTSVANTYWTNVQNKPTTIAGYAITDAYTKADVYTKAEADGKYALLTNVYSKTEVDGKISSIDQFINTVTLSTTNLVFTRKNGATINVAIPTWNQSTTGNAATATQLQTIRNIAMTGDGNWAVNFDGTANVTANFTLANSGVTAGTYPKVTVDAKGRVTSGSGLAAGDIPSIDMSKVTTGILPVAQGGTGASNAAAARNNLGLGTTAVYNVGIGAGQIRTNDMMVDISAAWNSTADGDKFTTNIPTNGNIFTPVAFGNVGTLDYGSGMAKRYIFENSEYVMGWSHGLFNGYMYRFYAKRDTSTNKWTQYTAVVLDTFNSSSTNVQFNTVKIVSPATTTALPNTFIEPSTGEIKKSTTSFGPLATATVVPIANGGTGATDAAGARNNLGLTAAATMPVSTGSSDNRESAALVRIGDYGLGYFTGDYNSGVTPDTKKYNGFAGIVENNSIYNYIVTRFNDDWIWQLRTAPNLDPNGYPEFRTFYSGTTWSPWRKFAVIGNNATFPYLELTAVPTTTSLPNLFIEANGAIAKSTASFGSAATKNTGTNNGDVMTVGSFGLGTGRKASADTSSVAAIVASTQGKTGVYRDENTTVTTFQWMPFLYMHSGDTHTAFSAQHQNEGVRVITWSDATINTPVIRNLYSDKSTVIYNNTTDALPNVYINSSGTLTRASKTFGTAAERNTTGGGNVITVGSFGLGTNTAPMYNESMKPGNLPAGFFMYTDGSARRPPMMSIYDTFGIHIPRHTNSVGGTLWFPYAVSDTNRIVYQSHYEDDNKYHVFYTDQNTPNEDVTVKSITIKNLQNRTDNAPNIYYGDDGKLYRANQSALLKSQADTYYLPINRSWLTSLDTRTLGSLVPSKMPNNSGGFFFADGSASGFNLGYVDVIWLSTYHDGSAGGVNALVLGKDPNNPILRHATGPFNGTGWTNIKTVAYTDSSISGNAATATKLQNSRYFNIIGAAAADPVYFDGTGNVSLNVTAMDATKLLGRVPTGSLSGGYSFDFTMSNGNGRIVKYGSNCETYFGLLNYAISGESIKNYFIIKTAIPKDRTAMNILQLQIFEEYRGAFDNITLQWYRYGSWIGQVRTSTGVREVPIALGITPDNMVAIIIGNPNFSLSYPSFNIPWCTAHFNFDGSNYKGWSIEQRNDLTGYTEVVDLVNKETTTAVNWSRVGSKPTTLAGYGITDACSTTDSDNRYVMLNESRAIALNNSLTLRKLSLARVGGIGGISWYSEGYTAWQDYMAPHGSGNGFAGNITAPSGSLVTTWAKRSFIENSSTYGWTFESGTAQSTTPVVVAEIRSSDGAARFGGTVQADGGFRFPNNTWNPVGDDVFIGDKDVVGALCIKSANVASMAGIAFFNQAGGRLGTFFSRDGDFWFDKRITSDNGFYSGATITLKTPIVKNSIAELGTGTDAALYTATRAVDGSAPRWLPFIHGSTVSGSGYINHCSLGMYRNQNSWENAGFYMAVGGSDASPTEAFYFRLGSRLEHSSGQIKTTTLTVDNWVTAGTLSTNSGYIVSDSHIANYTNAWAAQTVLSGGLLASNDYSTAERTKIPANGIYSKGNISAGSNVLVSNVVQFTNTRTGINWDMNTDFARIYFKNDGNADTNSYLAFEVGDDNNEHFKWFISGSENMALKPQGLTVKAGLGVASDVSVAASKIPTLGIYSQGNVFTDSALVGYRIGVTNTSGSTGQGISLYGGAVDGAPAYGFMFAGTATFGTHGDTAADWATYFTMSSGAQRGWIFRMDNNTNVASISARGHAYFNYVYSYGDVTAFSDRRLKENIESITNALSKVKELNGVTYTRSDLDNKERTHIGLIAQDVQAVFPEAVHENNDGYLSLNYMGLVGSLVEAIKELDTKNQSLEARLAKLEEKLS